MFKNKIEPASILVADDDETYRGFLSELLKEQGYNVV